ncbi:DNA repair and recombination protein RAD54-like [Bradysia coprophila]|uniref:DNA repair and recombination protein RAD54-like n=1 Tax=Bradysia coprophila TaxID=38358 RepID=UPI00187D8179|nr:DNA repair and recombination protein RAD54-like [Bradysia coprophila]
MDSSLALQMKKQREEREKENDAAMVNTRKVKRFSQLVKKSLFDENRIENPLVLCGQQGENIAVVVDERLSKELQQHQREGVVKMYNIVSDYRPADVKRKIQQGFILADKQGLGKTIQTLTVVWTLLTQSPIWNEREKKVEPEIKKVIIVTPKSAVSVWKNEVAQWLSPTGRNDATNWTMNLETLDDTMRTTEKKRNAAIEFMKPTNPKQMLLLSYDTFIALTKSYQKGNIEVPGPLQENTDNVIGLIVLDEAHLVKNEETLRFDTVSKFKVKRKIALSGTPLQNNLLEYHTLIDYVQPKALVAKSTFENRYQIPIMRYVEQKNYNHGKKMLDKLKGIVSPFFLRRTKNPFVDAKRIDYIVCCKMNEDPRENLQLELHNAFVRAYTADITDENGLVIKKKKKEISAFAAIHFLKDVCGHPQMVYQKCKEWRKHPQLGNLFGIFADKGYVHSETDLEAVFSPKLRVLKNLLKNIQQETPEGWNDRVVIVSYYTHVLNLVEKMCKKEKFNFVRFDGQTTGKKRESLIKDFNDAHRRDQFVMTLSSRAGGCGISLIGANHLIMFDPDWNPANDDQVMSRIYRDGQKKNCHIYRLLTTASIEEQIFRRQIVKKLMAGAVLNEGEDNGIFNFHNIQLHQMEVGNLPIPYMDEMGDEKKIKDLCVEITSEDLQTCLTHKYLDCNRCDIENRKELQQPLETAEVMKHEDSLELRLWNHNFCRETLKDDCDVLYDSWVNNDISFVFTKEIKRDVNEEVIDNVDDEGVSGEVIDNADGEDFLDDDE